MENIKKTLEEFLQQEKQLDKTIFNQLALFIFGTVSNNTDLYMLAKLLPEDNLITLIEYYNGDVIKPPSKKEYRECFLIALCYYLKVVNNWGWSDIKDFINIPKSDSIILKGQPIEAKIETINNEITRSLMTVLKKTAFNSLQDLIDNFNQHKGLFKS